MTAPECRSVVDRIRENGEDAEAAMEELYRLLGEGVRFLLARRTGRQDLDDRVHAVFLIVVDAIRRGLLRDPACLAAYAVGVARHRSAVDVQAASAWRSRHVDMEAVSAILADRAPDPEKQAMAAERTGIMRRALDTLRPKDREVLVRFYLREETPAQICEEMHLSADQFRLLKSRAKEKLGWAGRGAA